MLKASFATAVAYNHTQRKQVAYREVKMKSIQARLLLKLLWIRELASNSVPCMLNLVVLLILMAAMHARLFCIRTGMILIIAAQTNSPK